jgi:hypothetical protein
LVRLGLVRSVARFPPLLYRRLGIYLPGFTGADYRQRAVAAGLELLRATGHADPAGPLAVDRRRRAFPTGPSSARAWSPPQKAAK